MLVVKRPGKIVEPVQRLPADSEIVAQAAHERRRRTLSLAFPDAGDDWMARKNGSELSVRVRSTQGRPYRWPSSAASQGVNGAVTVEAEVFPVTAPANSDPQVRPYAFPTREQATRFVDEALLALEYLGCTLAQ